jgi:hypothetical protein
MHTNPDRDLGRRGHQTRREASTVTDALEYSESGDLLSP